MEKPVVSFLVSGRGSNFKTIALKILDNTINAKVGAVISDKENAYALTIAKEMNIPAFFVDPKLFNDRKEHETEIIKILKEHGTNLIVAAGYMRILSPHIINQYKNQMMNIHPALLPSFPGIHAQEQAINYGVKYSGCTVHFIDEGTDTGPIIMQSIVEVDDFDNEDTLSEKILKQEHIIFPKAVKLYCENKISVTGRKVTIKN